MAVVRRFSIMRNRWMTGIRMSICTNIMEMFGVVEPAWQPLIWNNQNSSDPSHVVQVRFSITHNYLETLLSNWKKKSLEVRLYNTFQYFHESCWAFVSVSSRLDGPFTVSHKIKIAVAWVNEGIFRRLVEHHPIQMCCEERQCKVLGLLLTPNLQGLCDSLAGIVTKLQHLFTALCLRCEEFPWVSPNVV